MNQFNLLRLAEKVRLTKQRLDAANERMVAAESEHEAAREAYQVAYRDSFEARQALLAFTEGVQQ